MRSDWFSLFLTAVSQSDMLGFRSQDRLLASWVDEIPLIASPFWLQSFFNFIMFWSESDCKGPAEQSALENKTKNPFLLQYPSYCNIYWTLDSVGGGDRATTSSFPYHIWNGLILVGNRYFSVFISACSLLGGQGELMMGDFCLTVWGWDAPPSRASGVLLMSLQGSSSLLHDQRNCLKRTV